MILFRIALRNLALHKFKTFVVGAILLLGTALVIVGNGLLDSMDQAMETSVINSITGHLQVHSSDAPDELVLFGNMDGGTKDIGSIKNFSQVRKTLEGMDEVASVNPMGINFAVVTTGNILDRKLGALRQAHRNNQASKVQVLIAHIKRIVEVLAKELKNLSGSRRPGPSPKAGRRKTGCH